MKKLLKFLLFAGIAYLFYKKLKIDTCFTEESCCDDVMEETEETENSE